MNFPLENYKNAEKEEMTRFYNITHSARNERFVKWR